MKLSGAHKLFLSLLIGLLLLGCSTQDRGSLGQIHEKNLLVCQGYGYKHGTSLIETCAALVNEQNKGLERKKICLQNADFSNNACNLRCKSLEKEIFASCQNSCITNQQSANRVCEDHHIISNKTITSLQ